MLQQPDLIVTEQKGLPDRFTLTRTAGGVSYTVSSRDELAKRLVKEARRGIAEFPGVPFVITDSDGRRCTYDPARGIFSYENPA